MSFQLHSVFENFQEFQNALEIYRSKTYSTFRIKSSGFTPKQDYSFVLYKCIHMEDQTRVKGTTKSKGLRPLSFALLPQEDFDDAMSRVVQLVELAQNRTKFILTSLVSNIINQSTQSYQNN